MRINIVATAVAAMVLSASTALAGVTPEVKCEASKNKTVGGYYLCREKAEATAITKGLPADYSRCAANFDVKWDGAETKGDGTCPDTVLTAPMNAFVAAQAAEAAWVVAGGPIPTCAADLSACEADLAICEAEAGGGLPATGQTTPYGAGSDGAEQRGVARSFTDHGDGTITDNVTGLMWEKKSDDGSIHDQDNTYTWGQDSAPYSMNGTMLTTFLADLNSGGGFAGHTDWRIPNIDELQSLVNFEEPYPGPTVFPAFNDGCTGGCTVTTCSCTRSYSHWSSSTYRHLLGNAWFVGFEYGGTDANGKTNNRSVRAVRAGS